MITINCGFCGRDFECTGNGSFDTCKENQEKGSCMCVDCWSEHQVIYDERDRARLNAECYGLGVAILVEILND